MALTSSRMGCIAGEVALILGVVALVLFAQDNIFGVLPSNDAQWRWDHNLQNTTVTTTPAPATAGTFTVTFRYNFPGVTTVNQVTFRTFIAQILGLLISQITITQILNPIPGRTAAAALKFHVEQTTTPGSQVIFTATGLTQAQAAAAQNTLTSGCPGNLASIGVDCASLAASTTTVPVAAPATDDDTSAVVGGIVGGIGGCLCLALLAAAAFLILKKKKQQQHQHYDQGYGGGSTYGAPPPAYGAGPIVSPSPFGVPYGPPLGDPFAPKPIGTYPVY